jgi:hypothetical protein
MTPSIKGTILQIETVQVTKRKKNLPDTERVDLIIQPIGSIKPARFQVRKSKMILVQGLKVNDDIEVFFSLEFNEVPRDSQIQRFDNVIFDSVKKLE